MKKLSGVFLLLLFAILTSGPIAAPIVNGNGKPMNDSAGRVRYIVDLVPTATDGYPSRINHADLPDNVFPSWKKTQMRYLARAMGAQYGVKPIMITGWVGNSFTA